MGKGVKFWTFIYRLTVRPTVSISEKLPAKHASDVCQHMGQRIDDAYGDTCALCGVIIDPTPPFDANFQSAFGSSRKSALNNTPSHNVLGSVLDFKFSKEKFYLPVEGTLGGRTIEQRHIIRNRRDKAHAQLVWLHEMTVLVEQALRSAHLDQRFRADVIDLLKRYEKRKEHYFVARREVMVVALILLVYQGRQMHAYPAAFYSFLIPNYHDLNREIQTYRERPHRHDGASHLRKDCSVCCLVAKLKRDKAQRQNKARREVFATIRRMKRVLGINLLSQVNYEAQLRQHLSLLRLPPRSRIALTQFWERIQHCRVAATGTNPGAFPDGLREADVISALCLIVISHQQGNESQMRAKLREFEEENGLSSNVTNKVVRRVEHMIGQTNIERAFA